LERTQNIAWLSSLKKGGESVDEKIRLVIAVVQLILALLEVILRIF